MKKTEGIKTNARQIVIGTTKFVIIKWRKLVEILQEVEKSFKEGKLSQQDYKKNVKKICQTHRKQLAEHKREYSEEILSQKGNNQQE